MWGVVHLVIVGNMVVPFSTPVILATLFRTVGYRQWRSPLAICFSGDWRALLKICVPFASIIFQVPLVRFSTAA